MADDDARLCTKCGARLDADRWMLCPDCQAKIEAYNREHWGWMANE
ncbi:hypothetical protein [Nocardia otitidiscaviarum]|nr:hypothetical protein [Nocardia otitidiscaviarum]